MKFFYNSTISSITASQTFFIHLYKFATIFFLLLYIAEYQIINSTKLSFIPLPIK